MMPVRLWDQNGQKVWQGNADAWGNCQPETFNYTIHQPLRLPGQFEDELTGIVQNRFRDYDPATGRYLTPDPYGIKGGLNSYRYTQNPVDYIDPLGLCDEQQAQKGLLASLWNGTIDTLAWVDEKSTIPALADLQTSMLEGLDEMGARAHASGNSWAVPLLGVTYAATYTLMPVSALDVVPGGKAGKLGKLGESAADAGLAAKRANISNKKLTVQLDRLRTEGHALERHGGSVTDEQLYVRARTGVAPDGSKTRRGYTPTSTAFNSDELLVQADDFLRNNYLDDAIKNAELGTLRIKASADMGVELGRGYVPVGKKMGLSGPLQKVEGLTNVEAWYEYDPAKNIWKTNTIYPTLGK